MVKKATVASTCRFDAKWWFSTSRKCHMSFVLTTDDNCACFHLCFFPLLKTLLFPLWFGASLEGCLFKTLSAIRSWKLLEFAISVTSTNRSQPLRTICKGPMVHWNSHTKKIKKGWPIKGDNDRSYSEC